MPYMTTIKECNTRHEAMKHLRAMRYKYGSHAKCFYAEANGKCYVKTRHPDRGESITSDLKEQTRVRRSAPMN